MSDGWRLKCTSKHFMDWEKIRWLKEGEQISSEQLRIKLEMPCSLGAGRMVVREAQILLD